METTAKDDRKAALRKIENLCKDLMPQNQHYVLMTTNTDKKTFDYFGSPDAQKFIVENDCVVKSFVKHCYNAVSMTTDTCKNQTNSNSATDSTIGFVFETEEDLKEEIGTKSLIEILTKEAFESIENKLYADEVLIGEDIGSSNKECCAAEDEQNSNVNIDNSEDSAYVETDDDIYKKICSKIRNCKLKCPNCNHWFPSSLRLENHLEEHNMFDQMNVDDNTCPKCQKVFTERNLFKSHSKAAVYECNICDKTFAQSNVYKEHVKIHKDHNFSCLHCGRSYHSSESLLKHLRNVKLSNELNCTADAENLNVKEEFKINDEEESTEQLISAETSKAVTTKVNIDEVCSTNGVYDEEGNYDSDTTIDYMESDTGEEKHKTSQKKSKKIDSDKFQCHKCKLLFTTNLLLQNHLEEHNVFDKLNRNDNSCPICHKKFHVRSALKRHYRIHTNTFLYECNYCDKKFSRSDTFKNHIKIHEGHKFICSYCSRQYHSKKSLLKHLKKCNEEFRLECKSCKLVFRDKENLEMHDCHSDDPDNLTKTYKSGKTDDGKHICGICNKLFNKRKGLLNHRKLHSLMFRMNVCLKCNKNFNTKEILKKHESTVHVKGKKFVCDFCGKRFGRADCLKQHLKIHSQEKLECSVCGKFLSSKNALEIHMRIHENSVPYICETCGKSFRQQSNLQSHVINVHTNKANFQCEKCPRKLKSLALWKVHMRFHACKEGLNYANTESLGKFYNCSSCSKVFATSSQYKIHLRTHSDERPFGCSICSKFFKERSKLKRHINNVHMPVDVEVIPFNQSYNS